MNDFVYQARDLNLVVFSMVIFVSPFTRRNLSRFITWEEASNLPKVAILALLSERKHRNTSIVAMIVAIHKQIFSVYICSVEWILSAAHTGPRLKFIAASSWAIDKYH